MSRLSHCVFVVLSGLMFLAGAFLGENTVHAQQGEAARIVTIDGVKLNAVFYASGKKNAPTVIMLHAIGEGKNIKAPGWKALAESLQKVGYSVLMFDFRGHGESTTIEDTQLFFAQLPNRGIKLKEKETLEYRDFKNTAGYLPILVNDIAAVKSFLDRKNDDGACNTSNTIVIGADQGATLGSIWINSEWSRYKYTPPMMFQPGQLDKKSEGKDIIASIFLTPQTKLGTRTVSIANTLKVACRDQGMATLLVYGKDDAPSKTLAKSLESALKPSKTSKKHEFIGAFEVETNLTGTKLLQDGLKTDEDIVKYLDKIVVERGNEWANRDAQAAFYMWRLPGVPQPFPARMRKGEKNLDFLDYAKFAQ